jgi:hypothetical protein
MYEMLPLLGNLPSSAFTGIVDDDNNNDNAVVDSQIENGKTTTLTTTTSQQQQKPFPPSYVCGNSSGMYNLRRDID